MVTMRIEQLGKYGQAQLLGKPIAAAPAKQSKPRKTILAMNDAEAEYYRAYLLPRISTEFIRVVRGPRSWPLANGHTYSPDFTVWQSSQLLEVHEVDGGFKRATGKQRDSRILFDQMRFEFPGPVYYWAEKRAGRWEISRLLI